ncbi:hypothetical protein Scep_000152 [Stephania cephalantha]|uniref:Uncharacterized protein n=1 Tax=Stephania cephalantha TaxID=152367 RepID=A0AAP0L5U5_9MAGN
MLRIVEIVVVTICCLIVGALAQDVEPPVLDTQGRPLRAGTRYFISPKGRLPEGTALTLVRANNSCPLYVGQNSRQSRTIVLPVVFNPFVADETIIRESSSFTLSFVGSPPGSCAGYTTQWDIDRASDPNSSGRALITTSRENRPSTFFKIVKDGNGYKLSFCPSDVCPLCRFRCGDAGIVVENGSRLLALHVPDPLSVVFERAT